MRYDRIMADQSVGTMIGTLYAEASPVITREASAAYLDFVQQVRQQFAAMSRNVRVSFVDDDPYADASELFRDLRQGRMAVWKTQHDQGHPLVAPWDNNRFRAVHDYFGHFQSGRGFDRHGEEAAWVAHSQMFRGPGRRAMTTETRGQNSAFIWLNGGRTLPAQKAVLLPSWVSEVPERWLGR